MDTFVRLSIAFLLSVVCVVALGMMVIVGDPAVMAVMLIVVLTCIFGALGVLRE